MILAHRYGSTDGKLSFTEKEYDYAITQGIPILGFIIHTDANWPASSMDTDPDAVQGLAAFRSKVKRKMVDFWNNTEDLHAKLAIALMKAVTAYPRPGWIRATESAGANVMNELSRLSKENADMRAASAVSEAKRKTDIEEESRKIIGMLQKNKSTPSFFFEGDRKFTKCQKKHSLFRIFLQLADLVIVENSLENLASTLGLFLRANFKPEKTLRSNWPIAMNTLRSWLTDFQALGLVEPSPKKHQVKDPKEYWSLTEKGKTIYLQMRLTGLQGVLEEPLDAAEQEQL